MTNTQLTPITTGNRKMTAPLLPSLGETRHGKHGGTAWSVPFSERSLSQPQDGSAERRKSLAMINAHLLTNMLDEPEDARLTGGTRSLTRRLLGLNVISAGRSKSVASVTESITRVDVA